MIILFLLGALQGVVGWVMVQSGLNEENLYVSHIRLAIHFITALVLLVYTFWFFLQLVVTPQQRTIPSNSKALLVWIGSLLTVQLIYGAFMAGLKAAIYAPSWPDINGEYVPSAMASFQGRPYSFFSSLVYNPITVQFIHRNLAYIIALLVLAWTFSVTRKKTASLFATVRWIPVLLVIIQVCLGIASVLTSPGKVPQKWGVFEWNAQLHQFVAILLLLSLVMVLFLYGSNKKLIRPLTA
jgi:cytochrome c oxidase assembly protein subunit 15